MKKTNPLKKYIKEKFKKYSTFCTLAQIDRYKMGIEFLSRDKVSDEVYSFYKDLAENTSPEGQVVTQELIQKIKAGIEQSGGLFKFSKDHGLSRHTVSQVIGGSYLTVSPAVRKVKAALNIL